MAGIISITFPFGGWTVTTSAPPQAPTAVNSGAGSNVSYNWAGYEATGGTFTSVSGTWTVPSVPIASSTEADATWVGIGGVNSQDLIQAGTQAVINGSGAPAYQAWYEMLPNATQQIPLTVSPGDSISTSLTETSQGEWSLSLRDNTTAQSYQTSLAYNSSLSSAEWIEEMPSDGSSFVPVDDFGSVSFTDGAATENGNMVSISGAEAQGLTMVNRAGQTLASPSALGADGESFTVTRSSASSTASGGGYFVTRGMGTGWRRTGVGIQGYAPRTRTVTSSSSGSGGGFGGAWQSFYQIIQELRQFQQQAQQQQLQLQQQTQTFREGFVRNSSRIRR